MDRIDYRLVPYRNGEQQDELTGTVPVTDGTAEIPVPSGFKGQIYADGFDNAGNSSGEVTPRGFVTDYDAPSVDLADGNSTEYTDEEGNALFVSDVSITASITDRVSGIREISWSQTSEKTDTEQTITLDNTGYQEGDQLEGAGSWKRQIRTWLRKCPERFTIIQTIIISYCQYQRPTGRETGPELCTAKFYG